MLVDAIVVALVVGRLMGGSFRRLADLHLRRVEWMFAAFLIQYGALEFSLRGVEWVTNIGPFLYQATFVLLLFALYPNLDRWEMRVVTLGVVLNFAAIALNGGRMPLVPTGLQTIGAAAVGPLIESGAYFMNAFITESTRLAFLGDIFALPSPYPRPQVFSIGDALMSVGLFLLVLRLMRGRGSREAMERETSTSAPA